ncbi:hypothetical protein L1887_58058 [Cichorium endivia]|nr:hypothetical protein L1887_58058 [Cichorium endivia]
MRAPKIVDCQKYRLSTSPQLAQKEKLRSTAQARSTSARHAAVLKCAEAVRNHLALLASWSVARSRTSLLSAASRAWSCNEPPAWVPPVARCTPPFRKPVDSLSIALPNHALFTVGVWSSVIMSSFTPSHHLAHSRTPSIQAALKLVRLRYGQRSLTRHDTSLSAIVWMRQAMMGVGETHDGEKETPKKRRSTADFPFPFPTSIFALGFFPPAETL